MKKSWITILLWKSSLYNIGFMQGRASPKYKGQYQAHPVNNWEGEFKFASENSFSSIEFIIDLDQWEYNPLVSRSGVTSVEKYVKQYDVPVNTVCCDFLMDIPLHSSNQTDIDLAHEILTKIIEYGPQINLNTLVIPCVDRSRLSDPKDMDRFVIEVLSRLGELEKSGMFVSLETDLSPQEFQSLLTKFPENVGVNYDSGNSASLGYDMNEEFQLYGERINDIHLKDRKYRGGSVRLGDGDVNFIKLLEQVKLLNYSGPIIMQAYRDEVGTDILLDQFNFLRELGW